MAPARRRKPKIREADTQDVLDFFAKLDPKYKPCRGSRNHHWEKAVARQHPQFRTWHIEMVCVRCESRVVKEVTVRGLPLGVPRRQYPKGYQMKGKGRIASEDRGLPMLAWLTDDGEIGPDDVQWVNEEEAEQEPDQ
jgi:hypothetical protein